MFPIFSNSKLEIISSFINPFLFFLSLLFLSFLHNPKEILFSKIPKIQTSSNFLQNSTHFPINAPLSLSPMAGQVAKKRDTHPLPYLHKTPSQLPYLHLLYKIKILYKLSFTFLLLFSSLQQRISLHHLLLHLNLNHQLQKITQVFIFISISSNHNFWTWDRIKYRQGSLWCYSSTSISSNV